MESELKGPDYVAWVSLISPKAKPSTISSEVGFAVLPLLFLIVPSMSFYFPSIGETHKLCILEIKFSLLSKWFAEWNRICLRGTQSFEGVT